jgi:hypothetical protein
MEGKLSASERRVLMTKWVASAWDMCTADNTVAIRAFEKCGISLPIDGSQDDCINIRGLEGYRVYEAETTSDEEHFD